MATAKQARALIARSRETARVVAAMLATLAPSSHTTSAQAAPTPDCPAGLVRVTTEILDARSREEARRAALSHEQRLWEDTTHSATVQLTHRAAGAAPDAAAVLQRAGELLSARFVALQTQLADLRGELSTNHISGQAAPDRLARLAREYLFEMRRFLASTLVDVTAAQNAAPGHGLPPAAQQLLEACDGDARLLPSVEPLYAAWHASYAGKHRLFDRQLSVLDHLDDQAQCMLAQLGYPLESLVAARPAGGREAALEPSSPLALLRRVLLAWLQELTRAAIAAGQWLYWLRATSAAAAHGGRPLQGVTDALSALSKRPLEELVVEPRLLSSVGIEAAIDAAQAPAPPAAALPSLLSPVQRERLLYCERSNPVNMAARLTQQDNLVDQTRLDSPDVQAAQGEDGKEFKRAAGGIVRKCAKHVFETLLTAAVLLDARSAQPALLHPLRRLTPGEREQRAQQARAAQATTVAAAAAVVSSASGSGSEPLTQAAASSAPRLLEEGAAVSSLSTLPLPSAPALLAPTSPAPSPLPVCPPPLVPPQSSAHPRPTPYPPADAPPAELAVASPEEEAAMADSEAQHPADRAACVAAVLRVLPPDAGSPLWASSIFKDVLVGMLARAVELGFRTALEHRDQQLHALVYAPSAAGSFNGTSVPLPPPVTRLHVANAALVAAQEPPPPQSPPVGLAPPQPPLPTSITALHAAAGLPGPASFASALAALDAPAHRAFWTATAPVGSCNGVVENLSWHSPEPLQLGAVPMRGYRPEHALALGLRVCKEQPAGTADGDAPPSAAEAATMQVAMLGFACTPQEGTYNSSAACYAELGQ